MSREVNDFYRTPSSCTQALVWRESLGPAVWEPACGDGAISKVLEKSGLKVISTDLVDRGYGIPGRDFLLEQELAAKHVVMNAPFKLADEFILHALNLGATKIAAFQRLAWLEGRARYTSLWSRQCLTRIWVFSARQTLWRGDQDSPGKGGTTAYGWFIFQPDYCGDPAIKWIAP